MCKLQLVNHHHGTSAVRYFYSAPYCLIDTIYLYDANNVMHLMTRNCYYLLKRLILGSCDLLIRFMVLIFFSFLFNHLYVLYNVFIQLSNIFKLYKRELSFRNWRHSCILNYTVEVFNWFASFGSEEKETALSVCVYFSLSFF